MLPLVRITSNTFIDQPSLPPQTPPRARASTNIPGLDSPPSSTNVLSSGRGDVLALSAQIQLAQGTSIFAETVGRLVKLPRREGETLSDYTKRLVDAIKALNPAERAALERSLNQLVKGITLQLLNQLLANPAGPDAARFAVNLETAKLVEKDLAAKAAVTSYQQNEGAEPAPGAPPRAAANAPRPTETAEARPAPTSAQNAAPTPPSNGAPETAMSSAASASAEPAADTASVDDGRLAQNASPTGEAVDDMPGGVKGKAPAANPGQASSLTVGGRATLTGAMTTETAKTAGATHAPAPIGSAAKPANATGVVGSELLYYEQTGDEWSLEPKRLEEEAAPRLPERQSDASRKASVDKASISAVAQWLADAFDEDRLPKLLAAAAPQSGSPEQQALRALLSTDQPSAETGQARDPAADGQAGMRAPSAAPESLPDEVPPQAARSQQESVAMPRSVVTEVSDKMVVPVTLPPVMRDGVPLAYVPYPPEERERDPEERKTRAVSATDEDADGQHSQEGHTSHQDDGKESEHGAFDDDALDDAPLDGSTPANDLYWRMAGWA
jgi:hypothetical protein